MNAHRYNELIHRIRDEILDMDRVVARILRSWPKAKKSGEDQDVFLDSVAINLHSYYSGIERLFELIAKIVDDNVPGGSTWHHDLLRQMSRDISEARPAVISQDSYLILDEFRRFRHLVRNVYTLNLVPERMVSLISALPTLWAQLKKELLAFSDFLDKLIQHDKEI